MKLFYQEIPRSPSTSPAGDMIFLHGFLASGSNLKSFAKRFTRDGYDVLLPDLRNHGQSPHSPEISYSILAHDVHELLNEKIGEKKFGKVILCGHSMGGKTVIQFLEDFPTTVEKLIVLDMPLGYRDISDTKGIVEVLTNIELNRFHSREEVREEVLKKIPSTLLTDFLLKNLISVPHLHWQCNLHLFSKKIDFLSEKINIEYSGDIPVLFVRGEKSDYISKEEILTISDTFKKVEIDTIPNAGHWLHYEEPELVYQCISRFLSY